MMHNLYPANRDNRDMALQCVTCSGQCYRDNRDTPLKGVTYVTLATIRLMVPIPPKSCGWGSAARDTEATHTAGGAR